MLDVTSLTGMTGVAAGIGLREGASAVAMVQVGGGGIMKVGIDEAPVLTSVIVMLA